jgi:serine/threonine protein kinase
MKTISINNIEYVKSQNCKSSYLIDDLIKKKKLRNDINKKNYLINDCDNLSYIAYEKISEGGFNEVYKIMDDKRNLITNKVLRVTKMVKHNNEKAEKELGGLFMQSYFSKICNNICKVYEFGTLNLVDESYDKYAYRGRYRTYAILEILVPLNEIMEKAIEDKKSDINFRNVFYGILTGLSCIHSKKYVHLDIKEYNIGIDEEKNAKIFDFGESVYLDKEDKYLPGDIHGFLCTMRYEAPEIFRNNHVFFNSDVFSLAIIMLKLYCNKWMITNYFTLRHIFNQVKDRIDSTSINNLYRFIFEKSKIEENGQNKPQGIVFRHFRDYFDNDISNIYQKIETNNKKQKDSDSSSLRSLLSKMLQFDPKVRISSTDALKEFWIKERKKTADSKNNSKVNNNNSKGLIKNPSKMKNNSKINNNSKNEK